VAKTRIALDSSVILDAVEQNPPWWKDVEPIYDDAAAGRLEIIVSEISVAECCRLKSLLASGVPLSVAMGKLRKCFNNAFIIRAPVTQIESEMAAEICRDHNLETCDAIIVATACVHKCEALYTRDGTKKRKPNRVSPLKCDGKIGNPALPILRPSGYKTGPLFAPKS